MGREPRGVLLDLDGTLCDSHGLIYDCLRHTLAEHAEFDFTPEHWRRLVGLPLEEVYAACEPEHGRPFPAYDHLTSHYRVRLKELDGTVQLFEGVMDALVRLRSARLRLAVVTTKHAEATRRAIIATGLDSLLDAVVTGDQCSQYKPHPDPYLRGAAALGLSPAQCAAVGDSPHDVASARDAGAITVAACWGALDRDALLAAGPMIVLEAPRDLATLAAG